MKRFRSRVRWLELWEADRICFLACQGCRSHPPRDGNDLLCEFCMMEINLLLMRAELNE
jgi:hypothetical protein